MTEPPTPTASPTASPTPRQQRMRELRLAHDRWSLENEQDAGTRFRPAQHPRPGSDYNLHNITIDASGPAQAAYADTARRILGLR